MFVDYMEELLGEAKYNLSRTEANWDCPFCDDSRTRFRMHTSKLAGHCFNCGWGGSAIKFVSDYQRVGWHDALDIVNFYEEYRPLPQNVFEEVFDRLIIAGQDSELTRKYIPLPSDFKLLSNSASLQAKRYLDYAKSRGLSDKQIALHGLGFCPVGEIKLTEEKSTNLDNHLFIQTYDDRNDPIYWMARAIRKDIKPKAFNPVGVTNTINKSDVIFNFNNAKKHGVVVINEGVFDATTVGDYGTALFGKTLSARQLLQLIQADLDAVYIMLDPDALKDALKIADLLSKHIKNVYLCDLQDGDPNEVGRKGCLSALAKAERYTALTSLKYKLLR